MNNQWKKNEFMNKRYIDEWIKQIVEPINIYMYINIYEPWNVLLMEAMVITLITITTEKILMPISV